MRKQHNMAIIKIIKEAIDEETIERLFWYPEGCYGEIIELLRTCRFYIQAVRSHELQALYDEDRTVEGYLIEMQEMLLAPHWL